MQRLNFLIAATLALAATGAGAQRPVVGNDTLAAGQPATQQPLGQAPQTKPYTVSPWSTQYDPLRVFHSVKSRAQVNAELRGNRSLLLAHEGYAAPAGRRLAGQPVNPQ